MLPACIAAAVWTAAAYLPAPSRPLARPALSGSRRVRDSPICEAAEATALDLVGDGGVIKEVLQEGSGQVPTRGAVVEVHYEGRLFDTGESFDSSRKRGKSFKFTLGDGKVIGGWEVGLATMKVGEQSVLTCAPQYAYGQKGIPPMIPPAATLQFDVELLSAVSPQAETNTFAEDNPFSPRTPQAIQQAYERKIAEKPATKEGLEGIIDWAKSIYIFGFFKGEKGEMPPWYLNPLITFPAIFAVVGIGFTAVVALDGLHRGEVAPIGDDLASFVGDIS